MSSAYQWNKVNKNRVNFFRCNRNGFDVVTATNVWQTSLILLQFNIDLLLNISKQIRIISTTIFRPKFSTIFIKDINRKEDKMSANMPV